MKNLFKNKKKIARLLLCYMAFAAVMAVSCFATEGDTATVGNVITDLSTMVSGLLTNVEAVFGFLTSSAVLPWVLLGVGVSLISVAIWWVKWIMWGR